MITTRDQLINALANNSSRFVLDKASIGNTGAGQYHSLWRATGIPAQAAIPTLAALCTSVTVGAIGFANQTAPVTSYLAHLALIGGNSAQTIDIRDRLAHQGGLSGILITPQAVALDLLTLALPGERRGDANYSDVQFFLEWYADTGATVANATVAVTYDDGTTGNLAVISLAASRRASQMIPLVPAVAGRFIRGVTTVTLSASTATAGNFGVTATRTRAVAPVLLANMAEVSDWARLGLPEIPNGSCLMVNVIASTTSTGTVRGSGKIAHG